MGPNAGVVAIKPAASTRTPFIDNVVDATDEEAEAGQYVSKSQLEAVRRQHHSELNTVRQQLAETKHARNHACSIDACRPHRLDPGLYWRLRAERRQPRCIQEMESIKFIYCIYLGFRKWNQ